MNDAKLHVRTAEDMAKRFAEAWHKAEQGQDVQESHLHQQPAQSVAALARGLGRDDKRVHEDVDALAQLGLVERDKTMVRVTVDEIQASLRL